MISRRSLLQAMPAALAVASRTAAAEPPGLAVGRLLAARRRVMDPNFFETVVLLIQYDPEDGAFGLTLNRPTSVRLAEALAGVDGAAERSERVFIGGPVDPRSFWMLLAAEAEEPGDIAVVPGVVCTSSRERIQRAVADPSSLFRAVAGYSGWAPNQLESEIERGDWTIHRCQKENVFDVAPGQLWDQLNGAARLETA